MERAVGTVQARGRISPLEQSSGSKGPGKKESAGTLQPRASRSAPSFAGSNATGVRGGLAPRALPPGIGGPAPTTDRHPGGNCERDIGRVLAGWTSVRSFESDAVVNKRRVPRSWRCHPERTPKNDLSEPRSDRQDLREQERGDILDIDQKREVPALLDGSVPGGVSIRTQVAV